METEPLLRWIDEHQAFFWALGAASVAVLVVSIFLIPLAVSRLRPDYFMHEERPVRSGMDLPLALRVLVRIGKNLLGVVLMVAGLMMFVLPGPGLLTLLVGFFLLDFPGKYRFEQWLVARRPIHRPINWLRRRAGQLPLEVP